MKISNILQVALMGWVVGVGVTNGLPLFPLLGIALIWSIPIVIANIEIAFYKDKFK